MFTCSFSISIFRYLLSFPVNFAFSSPAMCVFSSLGMGIFHSFKQTCRTILGFALVPFSSFYSKHWVSPPDCEFSEYTPLLFGSHLSLHLMSLEEVCVSKPGSKWRWQGNFLPPQQQRLRKKLSICMSIFYSQISWHIQVAKAQNLQHGLVLSHFLPFSLRCHPLARILQAVFSSSWRVLLKN